MKDDINWFDL